MKGLLKASRRETQSPFKQCLVWTPGMSPGMGASKSRRDRLTLLRLTYSSLSRFAFLGDRLGRACPKHRGA